VKEQRDIVDITHPLSPDLAHWPGDTPFCLRWTARIEEGSSVNLSEVCLSPHTGTHVDAPRHYCDDGDTVDALKPDIFLGAAVVIDVSSGDDSIGPREVREALEGIGGGEAPIRRVLLQTGYRPANPFERRFRALRAEAVAWLGTAGCVLLGTDAPSVDPFESKTLPAHNACGHSGITILELLALPGISPGMYDLVAAPLKIAGGDAAPVRAFLLPRR